MRAHFCSWNKFTMSLLSVIAHAISYTYARMEAFQHDEIISMARDQDSKGYPTLALFISTLQSYQ